MDLGLICSDLLVLRSRCLRSLLLSISQIQASVSDRVRIGSALLEKGRIPWRKSFIGKFLGLSPPFYLVQRDIASRWGR